MTDSSMGPIGFDGLVQTQCSSGSRPTVLAQPGNRKCELHPFVRDEDASDDRRSAAVVPPVVRPGPRVAGTNARDGAEPAASRLRAWTAALTRAVKDGDLVEGTCPRKAGTRCGSTSGTDAGSTPAGSTRSSREHPSSFGVCVPVSEPEVDPAASRHHFRRVRRGVASVRPIARSHTRRLSVLGCGSSVRNRVDVELGCTRSAERGRHVSGRTGLLLRNLDDLGEGTRTRGSLPARLQRTPGRSGSGGSLRVHGEGRLLGLHRSARLYPCASWSVMA